MLFDTLAVTGGKPKASSVGNVISVPEPTTALMAPAATPARAMARISYQGTARPYKRGPGGPTSGPYGVVAEGPGSGSTGPSPSGRPAEREGIAPGRTLVVAASSASALAPAASRWACARASFGSWSVGTNIPSSGSG